jgi:hypothetical protein
LIIGVISFWFEGLETRQQAHRLQPGLLIVMM